jgi:hypothetical protein
LRQIEVSVGHKLCKRELLPWVYCRSQAKSEVGSLAVGLQDCAKPLKETSKTEKNYNSIPSHFHTQMHEDTKTAPPLPNGKLV